MVSMIHTWKVHSLGEIAPKDPSPSSHFICVCQGTVLVLIVEETWEAMRCDYAMFLWRIGKNSVQKNRSPWAKGIQVQLTGCIRLLGTIQPTVSSGQAMYLRMAQDLSIFETIWTVVFRGTAEVSVDLGHTVSKVTQAQSITSSPGKSSEWNEGHPIHGLVVCAVLKHLTLETEWFQVDFQWHVIFLDCILPYGFDRKWCIPQICDLMRKLMIGDDRPWVLGYLVSRTHIPKFWIAHTRRPYQRSTAESKVP